MSQQLQAFNVTGPGFLGLFTEQSIISRDTNYALQADNTVIDRFGRLAARKGFKTLTTAGLAALSGNTITAMGLHVESDGTEEVISAGNQKLFYGTETLTEITLPVGYVISGNDWTIVNFNDKTYLFQIDHEPLVYSGAGVIGKLSAESGYVLPPAPFNNLNYLKVEHGIAAYGRLWLANSSQSKSVIFWSDTLIGADFTGGVSGSIDVSYYWPSGYDEIVGIAAHNGLLIVFGRNSILVFGGADGGNTGSVAASIFLQDAIAGVGAKKGSINAIGSDLLFVSQRGLRSLGRVVTEKSLPLSDLSIAIKSEFQDSISGEEGGRIISVYYPKDYLYLVCFTSQNVTYAFDVRTTTENGGYRVTKWPTAYPKAFVKSLSGNLLVGSTKGVMSYSGQYDDVTSKYTVIYKSPWLSFGDAQRLKILKKIKPAIIGTGSCAFRVKWAYDIIGSDKTATRDFMVQGVSEFGISEFGIAEFSTGISANNYSVNATGSGNLIRFTVEADIDGGEFSIQELNALLLIGKVG